MKRFAWAAAAAVMCCAGGAQAQTVFQSSGLFTDLDSVGGNVPENIPFTLTVAFSATPSGNGFLATNTLVENGASTSFVTSTYLSKVSDLHYSLYGTVTAGQNISIGGYIEDFYLRMPGIPVFGPVSLTSASNITFAVGKSESFGPIFTLNTAVPEASTWAMMMTGAGVAGAALRRRRQLRQARPTAVA